MKNKWRPREYRFERLDDGNIAILYRYGYKNPITETWCCYYTKEISDIQKLLTPKQFIKFKSGDNGPFIEPSVNPKDHNKLQKLRNKKWKI